MQNHHELQTFKTIYKISERFLAWYSVNPMKKFTMKCIELNKCIGESYRVYKICFFYAKIIIKQCYRESASCSQPFGYFLVKMWI